MSYKVESVKLLPFRSTFDMNERSLPIFSASWLCVIFLASRALRICNPMRKLVSSVSILSHISSSSFYVQPLSCSLFLSSVLDESFWVDEPERYPKGFYGFSTRIRANLSLGQRLMYKIPEKARRRVQSLSLNYELSACDTD